MDIRSLPYHQMTWTRWALAHNPFSVLIWKKTPLLLRWDLHRVTFISGINETVHSGCKDLIHATACLIIVLVSRIQRSFTGHNNFFKWKETGPTDRNDKPVEVDHRWIPNVPVGPNRNCPFHLISNRDFRDLGLNGKLPLSARGQQQHACECSIFSNRIQRNGGGRRWRQHTTLRDINATA